MINVFFSRKHHITKRDPPELKTQIFGNPVLSKLLTYQQLNQLYDCLMLKALVKNPADGKLYEKQGKKIGKKYVIIICLHQMQIEPSKQQREEIMSTKWTSTHIPVR